MDITMLGPAIILGLGCAGSAMGCGIAGMASHAAMARVDEGHVKFISMSAIPASQSIYAIILNFFMANEIRAGTLDPLNAVGIGLFSGIVMIASSVYQGRCAASGIQATARQPSVFAKAAAALGIIEGFSLFNFVFSILLL